MKQKLTNQDIAYLVTSLNKLLDGSYLVQIYDGSEKDTRTLILKLRKKLTNLEVFSSNISRYPHT